MFVSTQCQHFSSYPWSSLVEGYEQLDRPNRQTIMEYAMHVLHKLFGFNINPEAFCLGRYSLHLLLLKSSMSYPNLAAHLVREFSLRRCQSCPRPWPSRVGGAGSCQPPSTERRGSSCQVEFPYKSYRFCMELRVQEICSECAVNI